MQSDRMLGYEFAGDSSSSQMTGHAGLLPYLDLACVLGLLSEAEVYDLGRGARKAMEKRFRKGRDRTFPSPTRLSDGYIITYAPEDGGSGRSPIYGL